MGVTIRYGDLYELLNRESGRLKLTDFTSGRVAYGSPLRIPPFSKRRIFRNEKEVRFVCSGEAFSAINISIAPLKDRISCEGFARRAALCTSTLPGNMDQMGW